VLQGGVFDKDANRTAIEAAIDKFSTWLSQKLPEPTKAKLNLQKFAELHDRRCYQLIRFCFNPQSDYRTVVKALKEIKKRIKESSHAGVLDSLTPLLYRVSQLIYNKSHVAPIVEFSRTDELSLGSTAHEVLKEMSVSNPAVFKANVKSLSDLLQEQSPNAGSPDSTGVVDTLKACAAFAKSYPKDMPQDRRLLQALVSYALTGSPPAASKHAVTILMYSANRKELYASDLIKRCIKDFTFGEAHFLAKLACLGQLVLLAPGPSGDEISAIKDIVLDILGEVRIKSLVDDAADGAWCEDCKMDDEIKAKLLALKILVNRLRSQVELDDSERLSVMKTLMQTILRKGELPTTKESPASHRSRLRLTAAIHLLKLATMKQYDDLLTPTDFIHLAMVAQDTCLQVRQGFINKLKKYLALNKLANRFYTIIFLIATEVEERWKEEVTIWIRARAAQLAKSAIGHNIMEGILARLMSLLVHHPNFETQVKDPIDFSR
jgi:sister-chromatid-cohesion protein PDS5